MALPPDIPRANFTISDSGKRGIEILRRSFDDVSEDPADVVSVAWARITPHSSTPFEAVAVTFYSRAQRAQVSAAIQVVSGVEIVFFANANDLPRFERKILDFREERGFFLSDA